MVFRYVSDDPDDLNGISTTVSESYNNTASSLTINFSNAESAGEMVVAIAGAYDDNENDCTLTDGTLWSEMFDTEQSTGIQVGTRQTAWYRSIDEIGAIDSIEANWNTSERKSYLSFRLPPALSAL